MRRTRTVAITAIAAMITAAAALAFASLHGNPPDARPAGPAAHPPAALADLPRPYVGIYAPGLPQSYAGVSAFTTATGVRPAVVAYYSGWLEPFQTRFAREAARNHAVPLVQIDPTRVSLSAIASGRYDAYLSSYSAAVKAYRGQVILSFGHEMNGDWYSWGLRHTPPAVFVAAWRHVVTVFRRMSTDNVTWMWTVNVIDSRKGTPPPTRWWPGGSYVTWVGIDGYYRKPSLRFASMFGPTIKAVRALTIDPIFIAETSVAPAAGQPAKIANLFAGIHAYGLLGFLWFDARVGQDWRLSGPAAFAAFRLGVATSRRVAP